MSAGLPASSSAQDTRLHHKVLSVIGVVADVLGLFGAVIGFISKDTLLLTLGVVAVLLISSSWLWRRRAKLAICLLAAGCLCLGSLVTIRITSWQAAIWDRAHQDTTAGRFTDPKQNGAGPTGSPAPVVLPGTQVDPATQADPTASATTTPEAGTETDSTVLGSADSAPTVVVDETVTLPREAAVDVDRPSQKLAVRHVDGATGVYDLYHDWGQVKSDTIQAVNGPNAYPYPGGNPTNAYFTCRDTMASGTPYMSSSYEFCFRTSEKRVAYLAVTQTRQDHAFVAHVVVWADPAE